MAVTVIHLGILTAMSSAVTTRPLNWVAIPLDIVDGDVVKEDRGADMADEAGTDDAGGIVSAIQLRTKVLVP